jgi:DNA-binding LytR/AlgR family response regulator
MKININVDERFREIEVTINCGHMDADIERLAASLNMMDMKLTGIKDGKRYILDAAKILYIDTADKRTFLYTNSEVFETPLKLYELENQLGSTGFLRAGKSCLYNFTYIKSFKSDLDGRLIITMENDIRLIVSRQYTAILKKRLGV